MNVNKTEYIVLGEKPGGGLITQTRERILPKQTATYLGYQRENDDTSVAHLKKRISQANKAILKTRTILKRLPHLPVSKEIQMANTCVRTVFLYGTEACLNEALVEFKHEMNVMVRRIARQILRTSYVPAN